ncbi:hypothetical protein GIX45_28920 [Erwinia sp. CPCC 100877]|nr:hypothetical protein [Erwinia sp. CPCC 100877]
MFSRIAGELVQEPEFIQECQIDQFSQMHPAYGAGVASALEALKAQK